jgi:hypothetical protein
VTVRVSPQLSEEVTARAAGRCEYCHAPQIIIGQTFHIDMNALTLRMARPYWRVVGLIP